MDTLKELVSLSNDSTLRERFRVLLLHLPFVAPCKQDHGTGYFQMIKLVTLDAMRDEDSFHQWKKVCRIFSESLFLTKRVLAGSLKFQGNFPV